jgi:hypothetical protein
VKLWWADEDQVPYRPIHAVDSTLMYQLQTLEHNTIYDSEENGGLKKWYIDVKMLRKEEHLWK